MPAVAGLAAQAREAALELGEKTLAGVEGWLLRHSEVPTTPFMEPSLFPWNAKLEAGWEDIRAELDALLAFRDELPNFQDISPDVATITDDDLWKTFFFLGYGYRSEANCARCPATAALLSQVPGLITAFFSILLPHKHIEAHRGPYRGVLRYHLGVVVPDPPESCGISVGGEEAHWEEGKGMLFDDGYEHFAWNGSEDVRVVLFMDVARPLRAPASQVNQVVLKAIAWSPFLRDARRRHEAWERRFEALGR